MSDLDPALVPDAWDTALIGPAITPGVCVITQGGRQLKWDKKAGYGTAGATTKLTGIEPSTFTMKVTFYEGINGLTSAQQRAAWESDILPQLVEAESGKKAIQFYHPAVSEPPCSIHAVVPEDVGTYEQDGDGAWSVTVKFLEFKKPKPAAGTPKAAKPKNAPAALDENEKRIADLTKQLKELAN